PLLSSTRSPPSTSLLPSLTLFRSPGAVLAALAALSEEPFLEAAQRALLALGSSALPDVLEQLAIKRPRFGDAGASGGGRAALVADREGTSLNPRPRPISYALFCLL